MKLNIGRTLLLGFGFFGISIVTGINKSYVGPFLGSDFGLKANEVSLIVTLCTVITFLIQPMIGSLSDNTHTRLGRRIPFIIIFAPLAALSFAFLPLLVRPGMLWVFVVVLLLTTVGLALFRTPVIALMPDITPSQFRSQANGLINLMGGIGGILAFAAGAYLYSRNRALPFLAAAVALVLACAIVVWQIEEPKDSQTKAVEARPGLIQSLRVVLAEREKSALLLFLAIFSWFVGYNAVETFFTLYGVKMLKIQPNNAAFLLSFLALMFVVSAVPSGYVAGRIGRRTTILTGIATLGVLLAIVRVMPFELQTSGAMLPILLALIGIAWALINIKWKEIPLSHRRVGLGRQRAQIGSKRPRPVICIKSMAAGEVERNAMKLIDDVCGFHHATGESCQPSLSPQPVTSEGLSRISAWGGSTRASSAGQALPLVDILILHFKPDPISVPSRKRKIIPGQPLRTPKKRGSPLDKKRNSCIIQM